jgi:putative nucleotidyltransferase with HDIG domain
MIKLLRKGTNGDFAYTVFGSRTQVLVPLKIRLVGQLAANRDIALLVWVGTLCAASIGLAVGLAVAGWTLVSPLVVLALAAIAAVAEAGRVRLSGTMETSISLVPTLFAAVVFGPLASLLVAACSFAVDFKRPYLKWATYTASRALTGGLAGLAAWQVADSDGRLASFAVATVIAAAVAEGLDLVFAVLTARLRGVRASEVVRTIGPLLVAAIPLYVPVVAVLAFAYQEVSGWLLVLFFAPALAAQRLYGLYQGQRRLAEDLTSANVQLERANLSFATALVATLDARDRYTAGHSAAVAVYARDIATRLGLPDEVKQLAHLCGLVHDVGKIGLPSGLLEKPGALTLTERRQMETHSVIGERILGKVETYSEIANIVRHHHERWDGQGYPDGLEREDIPLLARIIAVADAYNAMTSDRPYRDAMQSRVARMRLAQGVESQFDTTVVAAFEAILAGATEEYRAGSRPDFTFEDQDRYSSGGESSAVAIVA